jgi:hypothetical protein
MILFLSHSLGIVTRTEQDLLATAYLYLRISTGEKVMILFLSHSLGIVTRTEQDLLACSVIIHL